MSRPRLSTLPYNSTKTVSTGRTCHRQVGRWAAMLGGEKGEKRQTIVNLQRRTDGQAVTQSCIRDQDHYVQGFVHTNVFTSELVSSNCHISFLLLTWVYTTPIKVHRTATNITKCSKLVASDPCEVIYFGLKISSWEKLKISSILI